LRHYLAIPRFVEKEEISSIVNQRELCYPGIYCAMPQDRFSETIRVDCFAL